SGDDELQGEEGNDLLDGGDGNGFLLGGVGRDSLYGGLGADKSWGGAGNDVFIFQSIYDSSAVYGMDTIMDFQRGYDKIDLRLIDANITAGATGDQAFTFRGTIGYSAGSNAGELVVIYENNNTILRGDINGDHQSDFQIILTGIVELSANDFYL